MTVIAIIDWYGRWGTSVFSENTAIFLNKFYSITMYGPQLQFIRHKYKCCPRDCGSVVISNTNMHAYKYCF